MKAFIVGLFALGLIGCQTIGQPAPINPVTTKTVYELRLAYTSAVLIPANAYRNLGLCPGAARSTIASPCAERAIVRKLQSADNNVQVAMLQLEGFARDNPNLDASAYINGVQRAIATATGILAQTR